MANSFHNHLKLSADSESIIENAKQIFEKWAAKWTTNTAATSEVFDKQNELHICEYHFILSSPPSDLYAELKAIDGITLEATYTSDMQHYDKRYHWTGEGDKYEVVEKGLTYPERYAQSLSKKTEENKMNNFDMQTVDLGGGQTRIEITLPPPPDPFDQTIIRRNELSSALWGLTFEPIDALEAGLTVFMDGHRSGGAYGRDIDLGLHTAAEPYRKLFDGIEDDEARLTALLGLAWALKEHVREHYPEDLDAREREERIRRIEAGEEIPF